MSPQLHWLLFCLAMLLLPGGGYAQSIVVTGEVHDAATTEPLVGAYVLPRSHPERGTLTDTLGRFRLALAQPDTLRFSYLGYTTAQRELTRSDTQLVVTLRVRPAEAGVVTVSAPRLTAAEFASTTIDRLGVYRNPAAKADPLLAVNTLAAATTPDETANVSLRGSDPRATGVYLNNVPVNGAVRLDQSNGVGQFSIFNMGLVRDLRVFPANPPVEFSQAAGGAIALYTDYNVPAADAQVSLHLAGGGVLFSRRLSERTGLSLFANTQHDAVFTGLNGGALADIERFRNLDGGFRLVHHFSKRVSLQVFQFLLDENYRYRVRSGAFRGTFDQEKLKSLTVANLRWQREERVRWELNQGLDLDRSRYALGNIRTRPEGRDYFASLIRRSDRNRWRNSLGVQYNHYHRQNAGTAPLNDYAFRPQDPSIAYVDNQRHHLLELFRYRQYRAGSRWLFGAGGRWQARFGSPGIRSTLQLAASYRNPQGHRWLLGLGRYYRYVRHDDPASGWGWLRSGQLSIEWQYRKKGLESSIAVYRKRDRYPTETWQIRGLEGQIDYTTGDLRAWLTAAVVSSRIVRDGTTVPSRYDLPYLVRAGLRLTLPADLELSLLAQLRRGTYFRPVLGADPVPGAEDLFVPRRAAPAAGRRLPDYRRVDLSLSRIFTIGNTGLIAYANVNNVFDRRNVREWSYNVDYTERSPVTYSRRVFFVGVQLLFGPATPP